MNFPRSDYFFSYLASHNANISFEIKRTAVYPILVLMHSQPILVLMQASPFQC